MINNSLKQQRIIFNKWYTFYISKMKILIISIVFGAFIGVLYYSNLQKTKYNGTLTFIIDNGSSQNSGDLGFSSQLDLNVLGGGSIFMGQNLIELMKTRMIIERTLLDSLFFENRYISFANYLQYFLQSDTYFDKSLKYTDPINFKTNQNINTLTLDQTIRLKSLYSDIKNNILTIEQKDKKNSIISLEVKSENELFSKVFCEQLLKETTLFYVQTLTKKSNINVEILQKQVDSLQQLLNKAIEDVSLLNDKTYNLNTSKGILKSSELKRQIDVQLSKSVYLQLRSQLEQAKVNRQKEIPLVQIIDKPYLPLQKEKISFLNCLIVGILSSLLITIIFLFLLKNLQ